jgi:hypothetical protein
LKTQKEFHNPAQQAAIWEALMTFIPIPNGVNCVVRWAHGAEGWSNVLHFVKAGFDEGDMAELAATVSTNWAGSIIYNMAHDVQFEGVTVYDARTDDGPIVIDDGGFFVGQLSGDSLPLQDACVLTLYTAARGRSGRGRLYMAGFGEDKYAAGLYDASIETIIKAATLAMVNATQAIGWTWVVASKYHNKAPRSVAVCYPIIAYDVRNLKPGAQRRRLDRP